MSLTPPFELGLSNAWLLILPFLIVNYGISFVVVKRQSSLFAWPEYTAQERRVLSWSMACLLLNAVYSVFVPLKTGAWLAAGLIVYAVGMLFLLGGIYHFASTPVDQPNTGGLYRFSRNPMYLSFFLIFLGAGLAGASWPMLLLALVVFWLQGRYLVPPEERMCLEKFGEVYQTYMQKTPRWIGLPR
ncbi:MAG: isoprenylcysteine carboxylmethyltransferase family protein [Anaerolineae bacterium]|nr:isoprenylcysteine carboxylmethyltransferase family protein [Anaerolineae bacterium]